MKNPMLYVLLTIIALTMTACSTNHQDNGDSMGAGPGNLGSPSMGGAGTTR